MTKVKISTKPVSAKDVERKWYLIDLKGEILGRITNEIAKLLQGKHKRNYVPYLDLGDNVVVINARKIVVSGSKSDDKVYTYYSGYPGGLREVSYKSLMIKHPEEIIRHAVSGKLPKNKLRDRRMARLHIYADASHPHGDKINAQAK